MSVRGASAARSPRRRCKRSAALRQTILESLNDLPYYGDKTQYQNQVMIIAVYLALFSPEFNISR